MGFKKSNPGCPCCDTGCPLVADDYNRADSGTIGSGSLGGAATEAAGAWSIVSNELTTSSSNARLSYSPTNATGVHGVYFKGRVKAANDSDQVRLLTGGTSNYLQLIVGASAKLELYISGSKVRECPVTAAAGAWHTLEFERCNSPSWDLEWIPAAAGGGPDRAYLNGELIIFGRHFSTPSADASLTGFGTGTITGAAFFDDIESSALLGANEVQTISRSAGTLTGGTWDITYEGSTATVAYNVTTAALKTALEALPSLGAGSIGTITGAAFPYVIAFTGATHGLKDRPAFTVDNTNLTGTGKTLTVTETVAGQTCPECSACQFWPMRRDGGWNSVLLTIANITNNFVPAGTGCPGLNGTYTLDEMTGGDCDTKANAFGRRPCKCYGLDGLSIAVVSAGTTYTFQNIRAFQGVVVFYGTRSDLGAGEQLLWTLYFDLSGGTNAYPRCGNDATVFNALSISVLAAGGCSATANDMTIEDGG